MSWLRFISSIIHSLAWPAALVFVVIVLREPLSGLIGGVRRLKYRQWQADFGEAVEHVAELAEQAALPGVPEDEARKRDAAIPALALKEPRAAVIESWLLIESQLNRLFKSYGLNGRVKTLIDKGLITNDLGAIIRNLRDLRHRAVHEPSFHVSQ